MTTADTDLVRLLWSEEAAAARVFATLDRGQGLRRLTLHAARRELAVASWRLRSVRSGRRDTGTVWRRNAPHLRSSTRDAVVRRLAGGAVLVPPGAGPSDSWRDIVSAAGVTEVGLPAVGMDGSLRVMGTRHGVPAVLRVGAAGTEADPATAARALRQLGRSGVPGCPRALAAGTRDGWSWSVEQRLPGARPRRVEEGLLQEVARWVAELAAVPGESDAVPATEVLQAEVDRLAALVPSEATRLGRLSTRTADRVPTRTAAAHGDLWSGNLLARRGRLTGVVDWDAFTSDAVAGTDLVHLVTTEQRLRQRVPLGAVVASRPWHAEPLRSLLAQVVLDGDDPETRAAVGAAWWLHHVNRAVARVPRLAQDGAWVDANVRGPLDVLLTETGRVRTSGRR